MEIWQFRPVARRLAIARRHLAGKWEWLFRKGDALFGSAFLLFASFMYLQSYPAAAQLRPIRRILVFYEAGAYKPLPSLVDQGIRAAFENSPYTIEFYREFMETAQFPDAADQQVFRDFYVRKYHNRQPDVIITVGPSPLQFMHEVHRKAFPGVPVVFCLPNVLPGGLDVDPEFTGVEADLAPAATLDAALRLLPDTKRVVVVGGNSPFDVQQETEIQQELKSYSARLNISYLTNVAMPTLLERIKHLPSQTIILLGGIGRDAAGTTFSTAEAGPMIVAAANAPIFTLNDRLLNHGEIGGDVSDAVDQGREAGNIARRILDGESPQKIQPVKSGNRYVFDSRALHRWGLKESKLPPGSTLLNRQPSVWDLYKWYFAVGISLIILEAVLISALVWQRTRRRKAELEVAAALKTAQESEQRFRHVANTAPVMIWMSGTDKLCTYVNQRWLDFTNRSFSQELGNGWLESIHPEDVAACVDTYTQAFDRHEPFTMQYRLRRYDGEYRWVLDRGVPRFDANHSFAGYIGSCVDVTDSKLAEEALSMVSRRLIEAQEQERTRIARELHDDVNQRIAILSIELDVLRQSLPALSAEVQTRLERIRQLASDIGVEVQGISHRLHSSKLEYLGLVAASRGFCYETAEWHKVQVNFAAENMPSVVPPDISLCLFRVLQESLSNAIKHSGAQHFEVQLRGVSGEIQLVVSDDGVGFDAVAAMISRGLGLISMRERVSLVNGIMLITSKPMEGTEIRVRVPIAKDASQAASGAA